ncbi:TPA: ATP-binding protein [Pseudomonas aeruginosa]
MRDAHSPIRKLARSSLRLNVFLVVSVLLVIVLVLTCYWSLLRLVEEEEDIANFHFLRLIGNIHSHEDFLRQLARRADEPTRQEDQAIIPLQYKLLERSPRITLYEGREFSFSLPFNLARREEAGREGLASEDKGMLFLGVMLSNVYSSYWTTSRYPATQVFLMDARQPISLAVPAMSVNSAAGEEDYGTYLQAVEKIRKHIMAHSTKVERQRVNWAKAERFFGRGAGDQKKLELIAFTRAEVPESLWQRSPDSEVMAVSLLDLPRLNEFAHALKRPIFDALELRSPEGEILAGRVELADGLKEGHAFTLQGLLLRMTSEDGWSGVYLIAYDTLFHYAKWHLFLIFSLLLLILSCGLLALRSYATRVVLPAHQAHQYVVESDAFSNLIIETGQVGICAIRRVDGSVVLENRLAREWLSDTDSVVRISREWQPSERSREAPFSPIDESQLEVNGRFLRVGFALTRYHGEDVILCTFHDITTHCLTEERLAEAKRSADAASEAKTVFLATMSHEIRTPLYGVLGTLELLGLTELTAQQREYLLTIQRSSSSLLQLISDILDVSKIESGQMPLELVTFCPLDLVEEVMSTYSAAAIGKGLQFYACVDPRVPGKVQGDAARIRQILGNLLSNAIKFTDMGRVVLRLRRVMENDSEAYLEWQVTDTGTGIPSEQQAHLFEPFYQVLGGQCTLSGTGLGLSICSRLSDLMAGRIEVVSEEGLGSSFTLKLTLPIVEEPLPGAEEIHLSADTVFVRAPVRDLASIMCEWLIHWGAKAVAVRGAVPLPADEPRAVLLDVLPESLPPIDFPGVRLACFSDPAGRELENHISLYALRDIGKAVGRVQKGESLLLHSPPPVEERAWKTLRLNTLVAEDNPFNQQLLKEQLEELGCSVRLCQDGMEAFQAWQQGHFDVLLTDVNMPLMNGFELAEKIRAQDLCMPIIGVTANAMKEEGERCMAVGMNACIVKPLSLVMLYEGLCKVASRAVEAAAISSRKEKKSGRRGSLALSEKTRALMLQVIQEDIQLAREAISREDRLATAERLHRIRGSWAISNGGELLDFCHRVEELLSGNGSSHEAFRAALVALDQMERALQDF